MTYVRELPTVPESGPAPLFQVRTFGAFRIRVDGRDVLDIMDLGPNLRKIFSILVSSPEKRVNAEQVQTFFWPESSARQGRLKLDTTVARLKSEISKAVNLSVKSDYITIRKGQLRIRDIEIDSDRFLMNAMEGMEYCGEGLDLLAVNCFRRAFNIWRGEYVPGVISEKYNNHCINERLFECYRKSSEKWCDIMLNSETANPDDLALFDEFLSRNPGNFNFVRKMYHIYVRFGMADAAADFIQRYQQVLAEEGLDRDEIEKTMDLLWEQRRIVNRGVMRER